MRNKKKKGCARGNGSKKHEARLMCEQQVGQLNVSVHHPSIMEVGHRGQQLQAQ